jgi:demethylspheroidene O-methyltransferase
LGRAEPPRQTSLYERWLDWRNRCLAHPKFQRISLAFWLTRPIARRRSRALFDLVAGFAYSQVLYTLVRLNLFETLARGPQSIADLAHRIDWSESDTERLVKAGAALGLVELRNDGRVALGIHGSALLGNPWILKFIEHHALFYADLSDPVALLSGHKPDTDLRKYWAYSRSQHPKTLGEGATTAYTELMAVSQRAVAAEILHAYDFGKHRRLLDLGGGNGTFIAAVSERHPRLECVLFDLPGVVSQAKVDPSVKVIGGSFLSDPLPSGADVVTLVRIVHDHDDESVGKLLAAIRRVLPREGSLVIAEPLSGVRGTESVTDAYFNLYFAAMGSGRTRTASELQALGKQAGFAQFRQIRTRNPLLVGIVVLSG